LPEKRKFSLIISIIILHVKNYIRARYGNFAIMALLKTTCNFPPSGSCQLQKKIPKELKYCVVMEAARCDQKWTVLLLLLGMVVTIS